MAFTITEFCKKNLRDSTFNINGHQLVYNLKFIALNLTQAFLK